MTTIRAKRPEARFLLTLASGRPRGPSRFAMAWCHGDRGDRMTLLRRRPREVYRVFTEEEYLNGAELEFDLGAGGEHPATVEPARRSSDTPRLRRAAGVTMLVGAIGAVGGVVALNGAWAHRGAGRRTGHLVASMRSRVAGSSAPVVTASSAPRSRPVVVSPLDHTRARVTMAGHRVAGHRGSRHRPLAPHSPVHSPTRAPGLTRAPSHPGGGVAIAVEDSPGSRPRTIAAADTSAQQGSTTNVVASAPTDDRTTAGSSDVATTTPAPAPSPERHAEFGFEH